MAAQLLPLFPLALVLLPSMPLPLHIFEERYREMMADIMASESEFGVVFAKDEGIVSIGCTAVVQQVVRRYRDGRLDLVAVGQRRFQITALDREKSYLRAEVEYFDDDDSAAASPDLSRTALAAYKNLAELENEEVSGPKLEPSRMSFQLGRLIDDFDMRQTVLSLRSEVERLEYLVQVVPDHILQRKRLALAKRVGPQNGHAKPVV